MKIVFLGYGNVGAPWRITFSGSGTMSLWPPAMPIPTVFGKRWREIPGLRSRLPGMPCLRRCCVPRDAVSGQ